MMGVGQIIERRSEPGEPGEMSGDEFELMTADEVATLLRVTKAWVYTQTRANHIPHVSLGRYVRYRRAAVLGWLAEMESGTVRGTANRAPRRVDI